MGGEGQTWWEAEAQLLKASGTRPGTMAGLGRAACFTPTPYVCSVLAGRGFGTYNSV